MAVALHFGVRESVRITDSPWAVSLRRELQNSLWSQNLMILPLCWARSEIGIPLRVADLRTAQRNGKSANFGPNGVLQFPLSSKQGTSLYEQNFSSDSREGDFVRSGAGRRDIEKRSSLSQGH